ncbi:MAG: ribose-phosphate diphosphokinase, partial [Thermogladius sp.]
MLIVPGSNFTRQSMELAKSLGAEVVEVEKKVFPDGELYVRLRDVPPDLGSTCVAVASTMYPNQDTALVETLLLLNAVHKAGGKDVVLVAPYLPYMRQDKVFLQGEPVSAEVVLEVLTRTIKRGLVVDVHNPTVLENRPWTNILVSDMLVAQALKYVNDPIVMAPDKGALERAGFAASKLNLEFDYLIKERDRVT